jgi:hypothetical protein
MGELPWVGLLDDGGDERRVCGLSSAAVATSAVSVITVVAAPSRRTSGSPRMS